MPVSSHTCIYNFHCFSFLNIGWDSKNYLGVPPQRKTANHQKLGNPPPTIKVHDSQQEEGVQEGLLSGADDQEREEESGGTNTMEEKEHSNRGSNHHLCHLWWSLSKSMVLSDSSATGVSKIPVNTRCGEERVTHIINRNG